MSSSSSSHPRPVTPVRRVFFSFHYRDIFRVSQVRNAGVITARYEPTPFIDKADWEKLKQTNPAAITRWINEQLHGASVTVVLIGAETATRKWVGYEIGQSLALKKGLLGIRIHNAIWNGKRDVSGPNPFDKLEYPNDHGVNVPLSFYVRTYDWVDDNGRVNMPQWIEEAIENARHY